MKFQRTKDNWIGVYGQAVSGMERPHAPHVGVVNVILGLPLGWGAMGKAGWEGREGWVVWKGLGKTSRRGCKITSICKSMLLRPEASTAHL